MGEELSTTADDSSIVSLNRSETWQSDNYIAINIRIERLGPFEREAILSRLGDRSPQPVGLRISPSSNELIPSWTRQDHHPQPGEVLDLY
ncbi:MAG: hypothetical protein ABSA58_05100, partial [Acetobacteraceae bacterium]